MGIDAIVMGVALQAAMKKIPMTSKVRKRPGVFFLLGDKKNEAIRIFSNRLFFLVKIIPSKMEREQL